MGGPRTALIAPLAAAALTNQNLEYQNEVLSNDGDLSHPNWFMDQTSLIGFSRSQVLDALKTLYNTALDDEVFLQFIMVTQPNNIVDATNLADRTRVLDPAHVSTAYPFLMGDAATPQDRMTMTEYTGLENNPNLFFMWVLCTHWSGGAGVAALTGLFRRANKTIDPDHLSILGGFKRQLIDYTSMGVGTRLLVNQFACHKTNAVYSNQKETGDVMRCVNNLQEHFDVFNGTAALSAQYMITINTMIAASEAFVKYRRNLQVLSHMAARDKRHVYSKEDANTLAAAMAHNALTQVCTDEDFFNGVIKWDIDNIRAPMLNGLGNKRNNFGYNRNSTILTNAGIAAVVTQNTRSAAQLIALAAPVGPAKDALLQACLAPPYFDILYENFVQEMADEHITVKQTHNIMMTTSHSAGANITHFPNYHLSRCTPLSEDDRNKSASSQDDATWVLQ